MRANLPNQHQRKVGGSSEGSEGKCCFPLRSGKSALSRENPNHLGRGDMSLADSLQAGGNWKLQRQPVLDAIAPFTFLRYFSARLLTRFF